MIVYPRSLAGLNLNPKKEEILFQRNDIETLLERICKKTYLNETGWEILRNQYLAESTCEFKKFFLNENFVFTRPLTVTGVILFRNEMNPHFHQMTLDRIVNGEYVLQNTQFSDEHPAAIRIKQTRPYFHSSYEFVNNLSKLSLFAGTPGFARQYQLGGFSYFGIDHTYYFLHLFCDWKTIWSLKYRPIDEKQRKEIDEILKDCGVRNLKDEDGLISNIIKIISLPNAPDSFCYFTFDQILTTLTMIIYPRSLAGLNLNPKKEESYFQTNDIETLLERICKKTYLNESGWEIVRIQGLPSPAESTCEFKKVFLNENFVFTRPLTVTGVILFRNEMNPHFHQMTLDRIENGEYVLQNTQFSDEHPAAIRIEQTRPYFHPSYEFVNNLCITTQNNIYVEGNIKLRFVNQNCLMQYNKWYLCPQAYSLTLTKI